MIKDQRSKTTHPSPRPFQADLTALDTQALPQLVWNETVDRPRAEETPIPSVGLLLVQADGESCICVFHELVGDVVVYITN